MLIKLFSNKTLVMPRILVIDDDAAIAELVSINLEMAGYEVNQAEDGIKGQALAVQLQPDLVMLDLMLPKVDGFTVCQRLRRDERTADIPVLMLTALGQTQDKVEGFNAGADDYVSKPVEMKILASRISQQLKRGNSKLIPLVKNLIWGPLQMDLNQHTFTIDDISVQLTNSEFQFLHLLMENPQRIFTRVEILGAIGVMKGIGTDHIVDAHASRIRSKIRENGGPEVISVIRSVGFRLTDQKLIAI